MKDFFGTELSVGDTVAFMRIGYRDMRTGTVLSFTKTGMQISPDENTSWRDDFKTFQRFNQVIKKP
jgi:hypothetical protein